MSTSEVKGAGEGAGVTDVADVDIVAGGEDGAEVNSDDADEGGDLALERVLGPGPITCGN